MVELCGDAFLLMLFFVIAITIVFLVGWLIYLIAFIIANALYVIKGDETLKKKVQYVFKNY